MRWFVRSGKKSLFRSCLETWGKKITKITETGDRNAARRIERATSGRSSAEEQPHISCRCRPVALLTVSLCRRSGFNAIYKSMVWGFMAVRLIPSEPPPRGKERKIPNTSPGGRVSELSVDRGVPARPTFLKADLWLSAHPEAWRAAQVGLTCGETVIHASKGPNLCAV